MLHGEAGGLLVGAILLGAVHGIEPGHGWPVAASYALEKRHRWLHALAASLLIGVGHLISSIAMVGAFFYAKGYFDLTRIDEPITVLGGVQIGGPVSVVAGVLLILLGVREYSHGHSHEHGADHSHDHSRDHETDHSRDHHHGHDGDHSHDNDHGGDHSHDDHASGGGDEGHSRGSIGDGADRGLLGIAWFAFLLGFAHEEEFEIIALCAGSAYCLQLMAAYALTVIAGIVCLTLLLTAGYERYEESVERYAPYLPAFSAAVLVVMGLGFITGIL